LRRDQDHHVVDWVAQRIVEGHNVAIRQLKDSADRYIEWAALVVDAAIVNLGRRRWYDTRQSLTVMANASLGEASRRPTDGGPKGMPLLLKAAFTHHALVGLLGRENARLVDADLEKELQTGLALLGESRGQALHRAARETYLGVLPILVNDVKAAGDGSLAVPPEPLSPTITPGGRLLSPAEQRLTGHWVHSASSLSGDFQARAELHMVLLADGRLARTRKSVAFSSLRDSSGNWSGSLDAFSALGRDERGRWSADGVLLTLDMEDGSAYEYRYTQDGSGMVTVNTTGGERRYWTRGGH
jgi:hypothetical protein